MHQRSGIKTPVTPESAMSLERFLLALALASSMLGPGLPATARAAGDPLLDATKIGLGASMLYERPEHTSTNVAGPRVRVGADAQVRFHPNLSAVAAGAVDHQSFGEGPWGEVDELALSGDAGLRASLPGRAVTPYFQATLGLSYAVMTFGESIEPGPLVDDDPGTISPHMRTALGLEFGVSGSSATRFSLFVGLDASYYSYEREIDLGYDRDESFDLDLFGEMNESELDSWADGRLSPSLGFQVAFAP
jgi:hypothetical protein